MTKRRIVFGIAAVATVAAGLVGCSSSKPSTVAGSGGATAPASNKITIDGQVQNVSGPISCTQVNGNTSIGFGDPTTGIGAVVTNAEPPVVQAVGLGNLTGVTLGYSAGAPNQANAQATKSGNAYRIKGTAVGADPANPQQAISKSFEIDAVCP